MECKETSVSSESAMATRGVTRPSWSSICCRSGIHPLRHWSSRTWFPNLRRVVSPCRTIAVTSKVAVLPV